MLNSTRQIKSKKLIITFQSFGSHAGITSAFELSSISKSSSFCSSSIGRLTTDGGTDVVLTRPVLHNLS